jgi:hypothetical protein
MEVCVNKNNVFVEANIRLVEEDNLKKYAKLAKKKMVLGREMFRFLGVVYPTGECSGYLFSLRNGGNIEFRLCLILAVLFLIPSNGKFIRSVLLSAVVKITISKKNSRPGPFGEDFFVNLLDNKNAVFFIINCQVFYVFSHITAMVGVDRRVKELKKIQIIPQGQ